MGIFSLTSKKASVTLVFLIVSVLVISSGAVIVHEIKKNNNEGIGTGLVLLDNVQHVEGQEVDNVNSFVVYDKNDKDSSKSKKSEKSSGDDLELLTFNSEDEELGEENLNNENPEVNTTNFKDVTYEVKSEEELLNEKSASGTKGLFLCFNCDNRNLEVGDRVAYCDCDEWEKCKDYFIKSKVYNYDRSPMQSATDYCSGNQILREMYIDCLLIDTIYYKEKDCNDFNTLYDYEYYCSGDNIRKHQKESDYDCGNGACFFDQYNYINDKFVKDCNNENYKGDWVYYCTSTQVLKHKRYYDYGCSSGDCKIESTSWVDLTLVSKKGDSDYCSKRKSYGCSLCEHNDYDCGYDSECSGSLECMGPGILGCLLKECGCCKSDEEWNPDKNICEGRCECDNANDPCCDGCNYYGTDKVCDYHYIDYIYSCHDGECLGNDVYKQDERQYCSGSSSSCDGKIEWNDPIVYDACGSNEFCDNTPPHEYTPFLCSTAQCPSGVCCDTSCGVYDYKSSSITCQLGLIDYGCPWGTSPGDDVGKRTGDKYCSGSSASCTGSTIWGSYSSYDDCTSSEYCIDDNSVCQALSCSCDSWQNGDCGGGGCSSTQRYQTRICTPSGCSSESQCVDDASCNGCTNECSSGQTRCNGDILQTCGNYDDYSCLEWPSSTSGSGNDNCNDCSCTCGNYGKSNEVGYCGDGKDNDCDGKIDGADSDCGTCPDSVCGGYCGDYSDYPTVRFYNSGSPYYFYCSDKTCGYSDYEYCPQGCENGQCKEVRECSSNSDCGTDTWLGSTFCSSDDVYQGWRTYLCNTPGTTSSYCSNSDINKKKEECGSDYCGSWGTNYCKGEEVYHKRTCYYGGCSGGICYNNLITDEQKVQDCTNGCIDGKCKVKVCETVCSYVGCNEYCVWQ